MSRNLRGTVAHHTMGEKILHRPLPTQRAFPISNGADQRVLAILGQGINASDLDSGIEVDRCRAWRGELVNFSSDSVH